MRIFLIGMPGSGKSTIGRYLSALLGWPVLDLDKTIEQDSGKSIPEIFKESGENHFRKLEREALDKVIKEQSRAIISTGGGVPCFYDNLERMQEAGKTIYIEVPLETLIARTAKSDKRPLLAGNRERKISQLLKDRQDDYRKADYIITTGGKDSQAVAQEIATLLA